MTRVLKRANRYIVMQKFYIIHDNTSVKRVKREVQQKIVRTLQKEIKTKRNYFLANF